MEVSKRITKPTIKRKIKTKRLATRPKREINCKERKFPTKPCLKRLTKERNIIKKPRKTLRSLSGDLTLAKRKEAKKKSKGTKIAPIPKDSTKRLLRRIGIGPVCKKEKIEITARIKKKIKKIVRIVSFLSLRLGKTFFFLRPRLAIDTVYIILYEGVSI